MRRLIASTFVSLDGVMQSPGGPEEDPTGGFALGGDVVSAIIALKAQPGPALQVIGSGNLIQTRQAASLIDEYNVWTFPVVLGRGKRLFSEAARPSALRLVRARVSTTGVVMSTEVPSGDVRPGSFPHVDPSEKELARREKMADGTWERARHAHTL
jgi:hypothetical protein